MGLWNGDSSTPRWEARYRSWGFAQQKVRCPLSAVGAVYDRAFVPLDCENCAVIDRAYSLCGDFCPNFIILP